MSIDKVPDDALLIVYLTEHRDALLAQVAACERILGLSDNAAIEPTTSWLRRWWRLRGRRCPHCGCIGENQVGDYR